MSTLINKLIVATPQNKKVNFERSVIFIHTDDHSGSVGFMLNIPMNPEIADRWSTEIGWQYPDRIYHGGPDDYHIGYIVHSAEYATETSININEHISYTGSTQIVSHINRGTGPNEFLLLTGYSVWDPDELQDEIDSGQWMVLDFDKDFFFQLHNREDGWSEAVHLAAQTKTKELLNLVDTE